MKSSILIVSYLWKDTWKRWCEQPGSPLARVFVSGLLALAAAGILVAFQLLERGLRERLDRFGLNTLLVRETITPDSPEFIRHGDAPDHLAMLSDSGQKLRLRQLFARGRTEWTENSLPVFSYPSEAIPMLSSMLSTETPVICLSDTLPPNVILRVWIGHRSMLASVRRPLNWLKPLSSDDYLLAPQGWLADEERMGWLDTAIFKRAPSAPSMDRIITAVNVLSGLEQRSPPQIQSALPLIEELDKLKERQTEWRNWLAAALGGMIALVYGAIAVLEFRQNLFVGALLRSFGAPAWLLYFSYWLENVLLANLAALGAVTLLVFLHRQIFLTLGFSAEVMDFGGGSLFAGGAIGSIFLWVNAGAFLSSLPVAAGLRQPVGEILN